MKVKINEDEKHRIAVKTLKEWYSLCDDEGTRTALGIVLEYGMVYEEYIEWLNSQQT